jgi:hypothetical protein
VAGHAEHLRQVQQTLDPATGTSAERMSLFDRLAESLAKSDDPVETHIARTMTSFSPGLFAGGDMADLPVDNLELERAFRLPKGHERRIHGHAHAGVRIVQRGPSLLHVLDAHRRHPEPFRANDLLPWLDAPIPTSQQASVHRQRIMRKARSAKRRPLLLAQLERRFREAILA